MHTKLKASASNTMSLGVHQPLSILCGRLHSLEMAAGIFCWKYLNLHKEKLSPPKDLLRRSLSTWAPAKKSAMSPMRFCHAAADEIIFSRAGNINNLKRSTIFLSTTRLEITFMMEKYFPFRWLMVVLGIVSTSFAEIFLLIWTTKWKVCNH